MPRLAIRLFKFVAVVVFAQLLMSTLPAHAEEHWFQHSEFFVTTVDGIRIHVDRKVDGDYDRIPAEDRKVPVLLIHGTWGDARTWDFPGRSVMDHLAARGYDVYALDLRGMGLSDHPPYSTIDVLGRVNDAVAVASYIVTHTGRAPVVVGWSQGGVVTGILAASAPKLVAGVGFFSVPQDGFSVPQQFVPLLESIVLSGVDNFFPTQAEIDAIAFGPLMSSQAEDLFYTISESDSVLALEEEVSPLFFNAVLMPAWPAIQVPALVVDGGLDPLVGEANAHSLFESLGSKNKQFIMFPLNSHGWFLEDNHKETMGVVDRFLSQFGSTCSQDEDGCERRPDSRD